MNLLSLLNILENTGFRMVSIQYGNMLAKANFRSMETSQLIYFANQLTGLYIMGNLIFSDFPVLCSNMRMDEIQVLVCLT